MKYYTKKRLYELKKSCIKICLPDNLLLLQNNIM